MNQALAKEATEHGWSLSSIWPGSLRGKPTCATGITIYLLNGGSLEKARMMAAHESPRTTKLYDRTSDQISLDEVELYIVDTAKQYDVNGFYRLRSVLSIGKILAPVILYEVQDIQRFPRVQDIVSYCRLVKCAKESS